MAAVFESGGLRFLYPENWRTETAQTEDGWSVAVQSPGTAFMLLSVYQERPEVAGVLVTALAALRDDYPDLESHEAVEKIAKHKATGHDIQFFSLDLTNSCWTRCFRTEDQTILILCQVNDLELELMEPVLRAIRASLEVKEDDQPQRRSDTEKNKKEDLTEGHEGHKAPNQE